ncbi:MAG: YybH family protein [Nitrospinota bacterium]
MKPEQKPITGKENREGLFGPLMALVEFYAAFNGRDINKMARNWAGTDEVVMDNPLGGIKRGWQDIKEVYEKIFNGPAEVYVEFHDYTLHESGDMFFAAGRERGVFRRGETSVDLKVRTSRIFKLIDGRWRQVHHHGSIEDPGLLKEYQTAVTGA